MVGVEPDVDTPEGSGLATGLADFVWLDFSRVPEVEGVGDERRAAL